MTHEEKEKHRKIFERQAKIDGLKEDRFILCENGKYYELETRILFAGYLMHAKNQEIELPKRIKPSEFRSSYEQGCDDGADLMLDDCIAMIECQGIKVKE